MLLPARVGCQEVKSWLVVRAVLYEAIVLIPSTASLETIMVMTATARAQTSSLVKGTIERGTGATLYCGEILALNLRGDKLRCRDIRGGNPII